MKEKQEEYTLNRHSYLSTRTTAIITLLLSAIIVLFVILAPKIFAYDPAFCSDPKNKWFECYQKRDYVNQQAGVWCSKADRTRVDGKPSKRDECMTWIMSHSVDYRPSGLNQGLLTSCARAVPNQIEYKTDCYVRLRDGDWVAALREFGVKCKFGEEMDTDCADEAYKTFESTGGRNWYVTPANKTSASTLPGGGTATAAQDTPFIKRVNVYIKWITNGIGIIAVFGLVIAGIQYAAAGENPSAVAASKKRISNIIIGIIIYVFMYAALQWLIPGGLF